MTIELPILPCGWAPVDELVKGPLPAFYREDYSVMALRVGNYEDALRVLGKNGIRTVEGEGFGRLLIDDRRQIPEVVELLNATGISCVMADAAEQIYQG